MAGHSKWANIKHRKAKQDAKRSNVYTKLVREITVAAKQGGDPEMNPRLRLAIQKAQEANMTRDMMDRAVKRGSGAGDDEQVEEVRYEGYGPSGIAVIVECITNNRNRTVSEVRHAFTKFSGNLGTDGSVSYLFKKCGQFLFSPDSVDHDQLLAVALDAQADDVVIQEDGSAEVVTAPEQFSVVQQALIKAGLNPISSEMTWLANVSVAIDDKEIAEKILKMTDWLEELDDVQQVYSNADIADSILNELE